MRKRIWCKIKTFIFIGIVFLGGWTISFSDSDRPNDRGPALGLQAASANAHLGIAGLPAPEPELNTWIDGDGKPMDPVKFRDYRGKVIYLYFFQDW